MTSPLPNEFLEIMSRLRDKQYGDDAVLAGIPMTLPALVRAQKLQDRAAQFGFDWPNIQAVLHKLKEEVAEFEEACHPLALHHAKEELSDILFVCANLARHLKQDAEGLMRDANRKFERRFEGVAQFVEASGKSWQDHTLEELEFYWQAVKHQEKKIYSED